MSTTYKQLGTEIGELADRKAEAYGDSIARSVAMLQLLYPHGLRTDQYLDAILAARNFDKRCRVAQGANDEEDPRLDMCGYDLIALALHRNTKGKEPAPCLNVAASAAEPLSTTQDASANRPQTAPQPTAETASPSSASDSPTPSKQPSPNASSATDASASTATDAASSPAAESGLERRLAKVKAAQAINNIGKCGYCFVLPPSYWPIIERHYHGGSVLFCSAFCDNTFRNFMESL